MSASSNSMLEKLRQYGKIDWCKEAESVTTLYAQVVLLDHQNRSLAVEKLGKFFVAPAINNEEGLYMGENEAKSVEVLVPYTRLVNGNYRKPSVHKIKLEVYEIEDSSGMQVVMRRYEANLLGRWRVEGPQSGVFQAEIPKNVLLLEAPPF